MVNGQLNQMMEEAKRMVTIRQHVMAIEEGIEVACSQLNWLNEHCDCPVGDKDDILETAKIMNEELAWLKGLFDCRAHNMILRMAGYEEQLSSTDVMGEVKKILKEGNDGQKL